MNQITFIGSCCIGFIQGYVGLPLIFYLVYPIVKRLTKKEEFENSFTGWFTAIVAFLFLLMLEFGIIVAWLDLLSGNDEILRSQIGKAAVFSMFLGLLSYGLMQRAEKFLCRSQENNES